jgi:hypothetical protein
LIRINYMGDQNESNIPSGLFSRIIRRFGLEKQLNKSRNYFGFFALMFLFSAILFVVVIVALKGIISSTGFGVYSRLIISDGDFILKNPRPFVLSIAESFPGAHMVMFLFILGGLMLIIRYASKYFEKIISIIKQIKNNKTKYGK